MTNNNTTSRPSRHILFDTRVPRDPDARMEAESYCGTYEECSGSGKHSMVMTPKDSDCDRCKSAYQRESMLTADERAELSLA